MSDDEVRFTPPSDRGERSLGGGEELLDAGAPRSRRTSAALEAWARVRHRQWIVAAGALALMAALINQAGPDSGHPSAVPADTGAPSAAHHAPVAPNPTSDALTRLVSRAESADAVASTTRGAETKSACPLVPIGSDPARSVAAALSRQLPEFALVDASEHRNPSGTLCELDVRARNPLGAMVVVSIVAPPHGMGPALNVERSNDRTTVRDVAVFSAGWRVEVGVVAQTGAEVDDAGLEAVAHERGLRW